MESGSSLFIWRRSSNNAKRKKKLENKEPCKFGQTSEHQILFEVTIVVAGSLHV